MIYLLGGASRTGKSKFAEEILRSKQIIWIPLDIIRNAILPLLPTHNLNDGNDPWLTMPKRIYPVLEKIIQGFNNEKRDCIIEGDSFFPEQISDLLQKNFPTRACFIGSSTIDREFLRSMTKESDWSRGMTDSELDNLAIKVKEASEIFKQKCAEYNFQYIDIKKHEEDKTNQIETVLFEVESSP